VARNMARPAYFNGQIDNELSNAVDLCRKLQEQSYDETAW
jgi:hypothetical protein